MASKIGIQWSSKDVSFVSIELHQTKYCSWVVRMPTLYIGVPYSDPVRILVVSWRRFLWSLSHCMLFFS
jgi:hypothetical protein